MIRALVVDDAPDLRFLIREVLSRSNVAVEEATSGVDALGRIESDPPDVVILDVQMPDMDGWETLSAMRRRLGDDVGIILCTVRSHLSDAVRAYELGCDAYLAKPFDIGELAATTTSIGTTTGTERLAHRRQALAAARAALQTVERSTYADRRADRR
jgi:two-component system response regulator ResD